MTFLKTTCQDAVIVWWVGGINNEVEKKFRTRICLGSSMPSYSLSIYLYEVDLAQHQKASNRTTTRKDDQKADDGISIKFHQSPGYKNTI